MPRLRSWIDRLGWLAALGLAGCVITLPADSSAGQHSGHETGIAGMDASAAASPLYCRRVCAPDFWIFGRSSDWLEAISPDAIQARDSRGNTILHDAAQFGQKEGIVQLLAKGQTGRSVTSSE